jgi:Membrane-associated phospholipid phosphatase
MRLLISLLLSLISLNAFSTETVTAQDSVRERIRVAEYDFHAKQLILPASMIAVGFAANSIDGMKDFHLVNRRESVKQIRIDDYMEWGMFGWVFVCDLIGKEKNHWADQALLLVVSEIFNAGLVHGGKNLLKETRPDGGPLSFPSGHTANAFLGAHLTYKEFHESSALLAYSGYALASFVAASRVYNNRHWVCDVIAGAGVGILSVELAYLVYFPIRNAIARGINMRDNKNLVMAPMVNQYGGGVYLSLNF